MIKIWSSNHIPGYILEKAIIQKDSSTSVFIATLFTLAKILKETQCPLTDEWVKEKWCVYIFIFMEYSVSSVQSLSHVWLFATAWIAACQASLSITNSQSLLKPMSIESVMPSSHLILCCPLLLLPPIPPSIRGFSNESALHIRWPEYWSFSFSISPSNEHPGLISFSMDWLDLLAVQGTLKSLLQHHTFSVLSFLYSPTLTSIHDHWKNHSLD